MSLSPKRILVETTRALENAVDTLMAPFEQMASQMGLPVVKPPRASDVIEQMPEPPAPPTPETLMQQVQQMTGGKTTVTVATQPAEVITVSEGEGRKKTVHLSGAVGQALVV